MCEGKGMFTNSWDLSSGTILKVVVSDIDAMDTPTCEASPRDEWHSE